MECGKELAGFALNGRALLNVIARFEILRPPGGGHRQQTVRSIRDETSAGCELLPPEFQNAKSPGRGRGTAGVVHASFPRMESNGIDDRLIDFGADKDGFYFDRLAGALPGETLGRPCWNAAR
jgi:hypothetical protein